MSRFKELRTEKKLTQVELAQHFDIDQTTVSKWELGKALPDGNLLIKLAKFFDVSTDYLLGLSSYYYPDKIKNDDFGARGPSPMGDVAPYSSEERKTTELTEKEKALISAFRKLLPETQDFVLHAVGITDQKLFNKN